MSDETRTENPWPELVIAIVRAGLMLAVIVAADPGLRWEATVRIERALEWWRRRRDVPSSGPPTASPPVVSAMLEEARSIVRGSEP
ncbi:MAG: hypothetical protein L3K06_01965 [Thermoplasmata archaeon]|nr:hypothetical protein [Thermoplasmata archaeon]